jgi:TRAP-type C4-dicarboxylate transport system permease small subunit
MARFVFVWVFFCGAPVKKRSSKVIKAYARTL